MSVLAYRIAKSHVEGFGETKDLIAAHQDAMDCYDCEAFLQSGIDAFQWIQRADETIRRAIYLGADLPEFSDSDEMILVLLRMWVMPCAFAHDWIAAVRGRGYEIDNLAAFLNCEEEVLAIVQSYDDDRITDAIRELRDQAVKDHRNGETAEFI